MSEMLKDMSDKVVSREKTEAGITEESSLDKQPKKAAEADDTDIYVSEDEVNLDSVHIYLKEAASYPYSWPECCSSESSCSQYTGHFVCHPTIVGCSYCSY